MDLLTCLDSPPEAIGRDDEDDTGSGFKTTDSVFNAMSDLFKPDAAAGIDVVFQFIITGNNDGDWSCTIKEETCTVRQGRHDCPTCTLKMDSQNFIAMMNKQLTPMQAYSSGKLIIEGDILGSYVPKSRTEGYVVPGYQVRENSHSLFKGCRFISTDVKLVCFGLTDKPSDSSLTPLREMEFKKCVVG